MTLKDEFKSYLKEKEYTAGTIRGYCSALNKICIEENMTTLYELYRDIDNIVKLYEPDGEKAKIGEKGHNTFINALRRFQNFVNDMEFKKNSIENKSSAPNKEKLIDGIKQLAIEGWEHAKQEDNYYYVHILQEIRRKVALL